MASVKMTRTVVFSGVAALVCLLACVLGPRIEAGQEGMIKGTSASAKEQVKVPDVVGMKGPQARSTLLQNKLKCVNGPKKEFTDDRTKVDTVASQQPGAGTVAVVGTPVTLMMYFYKAKPVGESGVKQKPGVHESMTF